MDIDGKVWLRYLEGEPTEEDLIVINKWLSESEENRKEFFTMEAAYKARLFKKINDPSRMERARTSLNTKINKYEREKYKYQKISLLRKYIAIAAVFVGILIISAYFFDRPGGHIITEMAGGEIKKTVLPDSSVIWLNKNAILSYPDHFGKTGRKVKFEGEGYFEIKPDVSKPFVIEFGTMQVTVLGTSFNMLYDKKTGISSVSLITGEVEVRSQTDKRVLILKPGQRAEYNQASGRVVIVQANTSLDAVWHNNLIPFESASVKEISRALEKLYNVKICVSPEITDATYSGTLKKYENIERTLQTLRNSIPIEYKIKEGRIYIKNP